MSIRKKNNILSIIFSISAGLICFNQQTLASNEAIAPEAATGYQQKSGTSAEKFMISSANPLATKAGYDVLAAGGNAVDAMIATQFVLNLVEPQSSGIGGGALMLYWDDENQSIKAYDGRETAPEAAKPDLFLKDNDEALGFWDAVIGGKSVGTPGTLKLLEHAHKKHGSLPWERLLQPAINLAENGFEVSERLASLIAQDKYMERFEKTKAYFYEKEEPLQEGSILKNPEFAQLLRKIAKEGSSAFYKGQVAQDIVDTVQSAPGNPGSLSLNDLRNYKVVERKAVCSNYKDYEVCGFPPPTSGGITVQQILGHLESFDISQYKPNSVEAVHLFTESAKLAYADRALYIADPDFVKVPVKRLLDKEYLKKRASKIDISKNLGNAEAGEIYQFSQKWAADDSLELPCTSHISIIDEKGNIVSLTTTIESAFGSHLMTNGFLLNNELTDFSFHPEKDGKKVANRVEARKRPRSSMAPSIIFKKQDQNKKPYLVIGSPGGSRIINYVAKTIIAVLDWNMNIQDAIDLPHYTNRNGDTDIEKDTKLVKLKSSLENLGHKINIRDLNSGLHGIVIKQNHLEGGADPRREGLVMGQ